MSHNYKGLRLQGRDFSGLDLYGADFSGAILTGATFRASQLNGANFSEAEGSRCCFSDAGLQGANFFRSKFVDSRFTNTDLRYANLGLADMSTAGFARADLRSVDFRYATLRGVNLSEALLTKADFRGTYLPSPTAILGANWGTCSPMTTWALMAFDADCHPNPERFEAWRLYGNSCPYTNLPLDVERAAYFSLSRAWHKGPRPPQRPIELMLELFDEHGIQYNQPAQPDQPAPEPTPDQPEGGE